MSSIEDRILAEVGLSKPKNSKNEEEDKSEYVSYHENDDYILEEIKIANSNENSQKAFDVMFAMYNKHDGSVEVVDEYTDPNIPDKVFKPIDDDLVRTNTVSLPSMPEEYESTEKLVKDIREFLFRYFELPGYYEKFMPYLIMYYWLYEKFPFVPYLHFVGRTATGKSTAMEVIGSICYKPIDASGAITMASIFRVSSMWRGTLLLDEFSSGGESYREMISFLKSGVSNKSVLRVEGDKVREVKAFKVMSPKLFTSEDPITDAGLQSRTMVIRMQKNRRKVPLYRLKDYEKEALTLRNKLLMYRFRNLNNIDLSSVEFGFPELMPFDRRVQQVITPFYYLSDTETKKEILGFAAEQQEETFRERREALPGLIFTMILERYPVAIAVKEITNELNKDKNKEREYTEKRVANVIRKVLGMDIYKEGHDNTRVVSTADSEKIQELCDYYGTSPSVAPVASFANADTKAKTDEKTAESGAVASFASFANADEYDLSIFNESYD